MSSTVCMFDNSMDTATVSVGRQCAHEKRSSAVFLLHKTDGRQRPRTAPQAHPSVVSLFVAALLTVLNSLQCRRPRQARVSRPPRPLCHGHRRRRNRSYHHHPPQNTQPPMERVVRNVSSPPRHSLLSRSCSSFRQHRPRILHDRDPGF